MWLLQYLPDGTITLNPDTIIDHLATLIIKITCEELKAYVPRRETLLNNLFILKMPYLSLIKLRFYTT